MRTNVSLESIHQLIVGKHENPFELLGPHVVDDAGRQALAVRAFLPQSSQAWVVGASPSETARPMRRIHPAGLFEAICPCGPNAEKSRYQLRVTDEEGMKTTIHDPYAFPQLLTEYDLYLLNEGRHWQSYERMGAHLRTIDGVDGVNFAVWAPNATGVSIVGDFNNWDSRRHPMRKHIPSGFWELFVPGLGEGTLYKYQIRHNEEVFEKSDPYGFAAEVPPRTASKVVNLDRYQWHDNDWIAKRRETNWLERPIACYEVHLGSWKRPGDDPTRWLTYRETGPSAGRLLQGDGLYARRAAAGQRASVHGKLGLPDGRLLRGHVAATARRRISCTSSTFATRTTLACSSTGCPPTSPATATVCGSSTARRSTSMPIPAGRTSRLGHADLQLRPARGPQLPHSPTPCSGWTSITSTACASTPWPR